MVKLLVGIVGAAALSVLGHATLVYAAKGGQGVASAAQSTCAYCHGSKYQK